MSEQEPLGQRPDKGEPYLYRVMVLLGGNGTGKTSLLSQYVEGYRERGGHVVGIVDPQNNFPGDPAAVSHDDVETFLWTLQDPKHRGLLVLDDADLYMGGGALNPGNVFNSMLISNRHWQLDVLICGRRPQGLPKLCLDVAHMVAVFETRSGRTRKVYEKEYFSDNADEIMAAIPNERFKYVLIDMESQEVLGVYETTPGDVVVAADEGPFG